MNAATRVVVHGEDFGRSEPLVVRLPESRVIFLLVVVLLSALAFIYVKDLNRRLFIEYQQEQHQGEQLTVETNRLLLEQSAWASQARVQQVAEQQLNMQLPSTRDIIMLKA
jgi:cell division protein FtsL